MKTVLILLLLTIGDSLNGGWLERKAEGWAWYEDPEISHEDEKVKEQPKNISAVGRLADEKKKLEEMLSKAMLEPSENTIRDYMEAQHKWLEQADRFSHIWAKVLLNNPHLDPTASYFPISQYGVQVQREINREKLHQLIHDLSRSYGFFFFYEGTSKISQALSKVVQEFSKLHQWEVIAISVDGILLEGFSNNKQDNGIAEAFKVKTFPALFIVEPSAKKAIPIAYGLATVDHIEKNIALQFKENFGGDID
jgi:conjugal transfer pilus assembly protein TraF